MNILKNLKFQHLLLLVYLDESGSLTKASERLHITQPALSRWLNEIEENCGFQLFERTGKGMKATSAGLIFVEYAQRILKNLERVEEDLNALKVGSSRTFKVGITPACAPTLIPLTVTIFQQLQPNVKIVIKEELMQDLLPQLHTDKLDIVVGRLDNYSPDSLTMSEVLYEDHVKIIGRHDHPLADKKNVPWKALKDYPWIIWPKETPIRKQLDRLLTIAGITTIDYYIQSNSFFMNLNLMQNSNYISAASESVIHSLSKANLLSIFDMEKLKEIHPGSIGVIYLVDQLNTYLMQDFVDCLHKAAKQLDFT
ncbi:Galactose-binding protein regulator [Oligella ureolytica]|uniref:LysR family transcriptional regulator n=1 Tax=Oligella ureolytica TaxID=90244 RepID=UPI000E056832|nr:LysR substrate-binding domain-containing protein [Oligella ureolytica]SUA51235.1 Galactose-binding protein regulator [Oligella ureolytica]